MVSWVWAMEKEQYSLTYKKQTQTSSKTQHDFSYKLMNKLLWYRQRNINLKIKQKLKKIHFVDRRQIIWDSYSYNVSLYVLTLVTRIERWSLTSVGCRSFHSIQNTSNLESKSKCCDSTRNPHKENENCLLYKRNG